MKHSNRARVIALAASAVSGFVFQAAFATPTTYSDAHGDQVGSTNAARDIYTAAVDDDGTNLYFTINLNPAANLVTSTFNYGIGITTGVAGAGGDTSANATTHGNPYTRTFSIDSSKGGMLDFVGLFPTGTPTSGFGFNDFTFAANAWTTHSNVQTGVPFVKQTGGTGQSSITVAVPIADFASNFAMTAGTSIKFDMYSTGTGAGQTAYDSLADQSPTNATNSATAQYNGTALDSYTIQGTSPLQLVWNNSAGQGDGSTWDTAQSGVAGGLVNQNWVDGAVPFYFFQNNAVTFNDTNNGHYNVTLNGTVRPAAVTVDNSSGNYTISGTGTIAGSGSLTKTGTSTLILTTSNTYTGGTTITNGTLQLGNGGSSGSVAGAIVNNSNLTFNRSDSITVANAISGTGNVTQASNNLLTLSGNLSYQGSTNIQSGTLAITTAKAGGGALNISDNAALLLSRTTPDSTLAASSLVVGSASGNATITFALGSAGNPTLPLISASAFTLNGTNNVIVTGANLTPGSFSLISYTGSILGGGTLSPSISLPGHVNGSLSYSGSQVSLDITSVDKPVWRGTVNSVWTADNTNNWVLQSNSNPTNYLQGDNVIFDATGSANNTVDIEGTVLPTSIDVSSDYTFIGGGAISGAGSLTLSAAKTLVIANTGANDFSGAIQIAAGGTLQIGAGTSSGSIGAGPITNNGLIVLNRSDGAALAGEISGTGSIQVNSGSNLFSGSNSYDGATKILSGAVVVPTRGNVFGSTVGATEVQAGGSIFSNVAAINIPEPLTISGAGNGLSAGALHVGNGFATSFSGPITLASSVTLQADANTNGTISGTITGGTFDITIDGGGTWIFTGPGNIYGRTIINSGTLSAGAGGANGDLGTGTITNNGTLVISRNVATSLPNVIEGSGPLYKNNTGTLELSGSNTFTGAVVFQNGVLRAANSSAFGSGAKTLFIDTRTKGLELTGGITLPDSVSLQTSNDGDATQGATVFDTIHNVAGNNSINGTVTLKTGGGDTTVRVEPGSSLSLNGNIAIDGNSGSRAIHLNGAGVGTINGAILNGGTTTTVTTLGVLVNGGTWTLTNAGNSFAGSLSVNAGSMTVATGAAITTNDIRVASAGTLNVNGNVANNVVIADNGFIAFSGNTAGGTPTRNIAALNVGSSALTKLAASTFPANPQILNATSVSFADATAKLDIANNELLTTNSAASIRAAIIGGSIFSSSAGGTVGYADLGGSTEARFTFAGDSDLNGVVDTNDFMAMAQNFGSTSGVWTTGDFNYDGVVNALDFNAVATNFGSQLAASPAPALGSLVPEPMSMILIPASALLVQRRRRAGRSA